MSYVKISWAIPIEDQILPMLQNIPNDLREYIAEELDNIVPDIEEWMRANAPWEDRTGDARASLRADVETALEHIVRVRMGYENIPYDQYLENMQGGRFSILTPALDYWYAELTNRVQRALMGYRPRSRRLTSRRIR